MGRGAGLGIGLSVVWVHLAFLFDGVTVLLLPLRLEADAGTVGWCHWSAWESRWYAMILRRAVRGLGEDRPIEQLAGPELRAWILELRSTLSPISVAG